MIDTKKLYKFLLKVGKDFNKNKTNATNELKQSLKILIKATDLDLKHIKNVTNILKNKVPKALKATVKKLENGDLYNFDDIEDIEIKNLEDPVIQEMFAPYKQIFKTLDKIVYKLTKDIPEEHPHIRAVLYIIVGTIYGIVALGSLGLIVHKFNTLKGIKGVIIITLTLLIAFSLFSFMHYSYKLTRSYGKFLIINYFYALITHTFIMGIMGPQEYKKGPRSLVFSVFTPPYASFIVSIISSADSRVNLAFLYSLIDLAIFCINALKKYDDKIAKSQNLITATNQVAKTISKEKNKLALKRKRRKRKKKKRKKH